LQAGDLTLNWPCDAVATLASVTRVDARDLCVASCDMAQPSSLSSSWASPSWQCVSAVTSVSQAQLNVYDVLSVSNATLNASAWSASLVRVGAVSMRYVPRPLATALLVPSAPPSALRAADSQSQTSLVTALAIALALAGFIAIVGAGLVGVCFL
jgi:hypothetical protein